MVKAVGDVPHYLGPVEFKKQIETDFARFREMATDLGILVK